MARPRIDDVAKRAGVSKTSVSFAFNQPDNLNVTTRERILAAAAELGYRPSPIARGLANRRTGQLGLVVPQSTHDIFANPFMPELVARHRRRVRRGGHRRRDRPAGQGLHRARRGLGARGRPHPARPGAGSPGPRGRAARRHPDGRARRRGLVRRGRHRRRRHEGRGAGRRAPARPRASRRGGGAHRRASRLAGRRAARHLRPPPGRASGRASAWLRDATSRRTARPACASCPPP